MAKDHFSLTANGTLSLLLGLKLVGITSGCKIITTPFTFPATTHAIDWMGCTPLFADIDPATVNIDPVLVARLIDDETAGVLATHVYGTPCDHNALSAVCDPVGIPIVYDAAHSFGTSIGGQSVLALGAASATSFHASKLFSTIESGGVFTHTQRTTSC